MERNAGGRRSTYLLLPRGRPTENCTNLGKEMFAEIHPGLCQRVVCFDIDNGQPGALVRLSRYTASCRETPIGLNNSMRALP